MASHGVMMNVCQACKRQAPLYICDDCEHVLANMLDQIPWLLDELDARIQGMDRIPHGTIGRQRRPHEMSVIDFDACETARTTRKMLQDWVVTVAERHTGRKPAALTTAATRDLALWLQVNTAAIARLDCAGALYHDINKLVGASQRGGQLVTAINRVERHFAGPCPTIRGYDNTGKPIECGHGLYADVDERTVVCPVCGQKIDVARNLDKAAVDRDLLPEPKLLEVLKNLGEPVSRVKLYQWIREGRIRPRGWMHHGKIVPFRIRRGDPAVYSLARMRKLRAREIAKQEEAQAK